MVIDKKWNGRDLDSGKDFSIKFLRWNQIYNYVLAE